jgi:transposase
MRSIRGVGPMTALAFTLELDNDVTRLRSSRAAGALVGLKPKRFNSGESEPESAITKSGNRLLRRLLVQCAHYILSRRGEDSALRRWGLGLAERSGTRRGKRRALVATARKLAVLLHTLWRKGEDFDPTYGLPAEAAVK